jgi:hypothetical protein
MLCAGASAAQAQYSYYGGANAAYAGSPEINLHREVEAAETNLHISAGFMHTQYHENFEPGTGDDENGYTPGFEIGASLMQPDWALPWNGDLYAALDYELNTGNLTYGGHTENLTTGEVQPYDTTDQATFNRIEARAGLGFALVHGMEITPYLAGGYQSWNRNIDNADSNVSGGKEFYSAGLVGGGLLFDVPATDKLVVSADAQVLALIAANISNSDYNYSQSMGDSGEERLSLGLDDAIRGPFHVFMKGYWEHFNYAGNKPSLSGLVMIDNEAVIVHEPLSTTTQFGVNIGMAYSF